jgi:hypothetical protein
MRKGVFLFVIIFLCHPVKDYAFLTSEHFRVPDISSYNTGNENYKVSYSYKLLGNIVGIGYTNPTSSNIDLYSELLNLYRGPYNTVEDAYAFPNPCNLKNRCYGVTFTRLTLKCEIMIFSISGQKVYTINKNSNNASIGWDLKDNGGRIVSSGLYIFYIKDDKGNKRKGKLVIIR